MGQNISNLRFSNSRPINFTMETSFLLLFLLAVLWSVNICFVQKVPASSFIDFDANKDGFICPEEFEMFWKHFNARSTVSTVFQAIFTANFTKQVHYIVELVERVRTTLEFSFQFFHTRTFATEMKLSINHVTLVVRHADISAIFYEKIVGATYINRPHLSSNGHWMWLGNVQLHLIQYPEMRIFDDPNAGTRVNHISFDTSNVDAHEQRLIEAGIPYQRVSVPVGENFITQIFFQDPDHHWIEFCDCSNINDFVLGRFDEERAQQLAQFNREENHLQESFFSTAALTTLSDKLDTNSVTQLLSKYSNTTHTMSYSANDEEILSVEGLELVLSQTSQYLKNQTITDMLQNYNRFQMNESATFFVVQRHINNNTPVHISEPLIIKEQPISHHNNSSGVILQQEVIAVLGLSTIQLSQEKNPEINSNCDGNINKEEFCSSFPFFKN